MNFLTGIFAEKVTPKIDLAIDFDAMLKTLPMMVSGMVGIFISIGIIMFGIWVMGSLSAKKSKKDENK